MNPDNGFFNNISSFTKEHPYISKGTLGIAVLGYGLWDGGKRIVSWFSGGTTPTAQKTHSAAEKNIYDKVQEQPASAAPIQSIPVHPTQHLLTANFTPEEFEHKILQTFRTISRLTSGMDEGESAKYSAKLQVYEENYRNSAEKSYRTGQSDPDHSELAEAMNRYLEETNDLIRELQSPKKE